MNSWEWVNEHGDPSPGLDPEQESGPAWRLVGPTTEPPGALRLSLGLRLGPGLPPGMGEGPDSWSQPS